MFFLVCRVSPQQQQQRQQQLQVTSRLHRAGVVIKVARNSRIQTYTHTLSLSNVVPYVRCVLANGLDLSNGIVANASYPGLPVALSPPSSSLDVCTCRAVFGLSALDSLTGRLALFIASFFLEESTFSAIKVQFWGTTIW